MSQSGVFGVQILDKYLRQNNDGSVLYSTDIVYEGSLQKFCSPSPSGSSSEPPGMTKKLLQGALEANNRPAKKYFYLSASSSGWCFVCTYRQTYIRSTYIRESLKYWQSDEKTALRDIMIATAGSGKGCIFTTVHYSSLLSTCHAPHKIYCIRSV